MDMNRVIFLKVVVGSLVWLSFKCNVYRIIFFFMFVFYLVIDDLYMNDFLYEISFDYFVF